MVLNSVTDRLDLITNTYFDVEVGWVTKDSSELFSLVFHVHLLDFTWFQIVGS